MWKVAPPLLLPPKMGGCPDSREEVARGDERTGKKEKQVLEKGKLDGCGGSHLP